MLVDLITGLLGLFSGLSWHGPDISIRLHHALIDASKPTKDTVTLMSELLRVVLSGSLLRHILAQGLDRALKSVLLRDQVFIFHGCVLVAFNLHVLPLV